MTKNKILYFHGFGSNFDSNSKKIKVLEELGDVFGYDIDYTSHAEEVLKRASSTALNLKPDFVIGTSMGGWLASHVGARMGIPFVAINPAIAPMKTLMDRVGTFKDYSGNTISLTESIVTTYFPLSLNGCGLILLDEGDTQFDSKNTKSLLENYYPIRVFPGGSHQFDHMIEAIPHINNFLSITAFSYGQDTN